MPNSARIVLNKLKMLLLCGIFWVNQSKISCSIHIRRHNLTASQTVPYQALFLWLIYNHIILCHCLWWACFGVSWKPSASQMLKGVIGCQWPLIELLYSMPWWWEQAGEPHTFQGQTFSHLHHNKCQSDFKLTFSTYVTEPTSSGFTSAFYTVDTTNVLAKTQLVVMEQHDS